MLLLPPILLLLLSVSVTHIPKSICQAPVCSSRKFSDCMNGGAVLTPSPSPASPPTQTISPPQAPPPGPPPPSPSPGKTTGNTTTETPATDPHPLRTGKSWPLITGLGIGSAALMLIAVISFWLAKKYSWWEAMMHSWNSDGGGTNNQLVEEFMRKYGSTAPRLYSFPEIKKMTESFSDQLGRGGYGCVYRGTTSDGREVAVKVLNDNTGNGEDFINEVAAISSTAHVNVVALLGFCCSNKKRALIYEFIPNGSLDKFIGVPLQWQLLFEIAVGIASGLDYLHRGCNTRIVHFDIKPQNILLDADFCPKISDFGLARLYKKKQSVLSTMDARGTVGYIAPEVFSRNFGGVSHKSDVYSYGMMVLEMAGMTRRFDIDSGKTSESYFPNWIYNHVEFGREVPIEGVRNEEEKEIAMKMILVGLWCIQTNSSDRPSISKVVDMLEGSLESLQMPPKPYICSISGTDEFQP